MLVLHNQMYWLHDGLPFYVLYIKWFTKCNFMINEFGTDYQTTNPEQGGNNAEAKKTASIVH